MLQRNYEIIPKRMYFSEKCFVKVELGVGKQKSLNDKRDDIMKREGALVTNLNDTWYLTMFSAYRRKRSSKSHERRVRLEVKILEPSLSWTREI